MSEGPGNRSKHWNQAIVAKACSDLHSEGITPTVSSIRSKLKIDKGSDSTVQRFIRAWREELSDIEQPPAPEPLMTALSALWDQALTAARLEMEDRESSLRSERNSFKKEALAIEESLMDYENKISSLQSQANIDQRELTEAGDLLEQQTGAIQSLSQKVRQCEIECEMLRSRMSEAEDEASRYKEQVLMANGLIATVKQTEREGFKQRLKILAQQINSNDDKKVIKESVNLLINDWVEGD